MDLAMLLLRVVVGVLFVGHGTQKLFGWWGGPGLDGATKMMGALGYRPPRQHALLSGLTESIGGSLLVLGLFTPFAAAAIIGVMVNAIAAVHGSKGLWITQGGYEYNAVLLTAVLAPAIAGAGDASLDHGLGWDSNIWWGMFALLLGIIGGCAVLATRDTSEATIGAEQDLREAEQDQAGEARGRPRQHRRAA
jgi:putative oxidoreductase